MLGERLSEISVNKRKRKTVKINLLHILEERHSLLGDEGSCSDLSANLCEIEDSEAEEPPAVPPPPARHTDV